jgi:hypothetical protein
MVPSLPPKRLLTLGVELVLQLVDGDDVLRRLMFGLISVLETGFLARVDLLQADLSFAVDTEQFFNRR